MSESVAATDLGLGLGLFFGVLAVVGAIGMFVTHANHLAAGAGFAIAIVAGALSIAAIHLYD